MTPFGTVVGFRYLFRSAGSDRPETREYCFVEYSTREASYSFLKPPPCLEIVLLHVVTLIMEDIGLCNVFVY